MWVKNNQKAKKRLTLYWIDQFLPFVENRCNFWITISAKPYFELSIYYKVNSFDGVQKSVILIRTILRRHSKKFLQKIRLTPLLLNITLVRDMNLVHFLKLKTSKVYFFSRQTKIAKTITLVILFV